MFELNNQAAKVTIHVRPEIHGEDRVSAMDLRFVAAISNDMLSEFDPVLKGALYKADPVQGNLDKSYLPIYKFPAIASFKWAYEGSGYTTIVHFGATGKADICLLDCKFDKIKFTPKDGAQLVMEFRIIAHPDKKQAGELYTMTGQQVEVTLIAPEEDQEPGKE